ncbi:MAG TPA: UdgX family uracil-DNA binding protein [Acidimicrobiia bacterium]
MAESLDGLRQQASHCTDCDLHARATQTVFGDGPPDARVVLVGEQPGDHEDRDGHPFVGPAGRLLTRALEDAGLDRGAVYVTNAVKHFKWRPAGKVRLHQKPNAAEVRACSQWWQRELRVIQPDLTVLLGATAAQAVAGSKVRVTRDRGQVLTTDHGEVLVTMHPSAVLRLQHEERAQAYDALVADLRVAADYVNALTRPDRSSPGGS